MPKASAPKRAYKTVKSIPLGFQIEDNTKCLWKVGQVVGQGGFGRLYGACRADNPTQSNHVIKIEPQENGPLFNEIHFYMRVCKPELLEKWKLDHSLKFLGIPRFISKGTFESPEGQRCRFLIMDKFNGSLEDSLIKRILLPTDIIQITVNVINALHFIHSMDYVHCDVKASNLLSGDRKNLYYLADFGLATLYRVNGRHNPQTTSPKLKDNGTLEFCSRDSHAGLPPSRRGDLEILVFNLIHWLYRCHQGAPQTPCAGLPWEHLISDPSVRLKISESVRNKVVQSKQENMTNPSLFAQAAGFGKIPDLEKLVKTVASLGYSEEPNYAQLIFLLNRLATHNAMDSKKKTVFSENHSSNKITPSPIVVTTPNNHVNARKKLQCSSPSIDCLTDPKRAALKISKSIYEYCGSSFDDHFRDDMEIGQIRRSPRLNKQFNQHSNTVKPSKCISPLVCIEKKSTHSQTSPYMLALAKSHVAKKK